MSGSSHGICEVSPGAAIAGWDPPAGARVAVACSGGLDSVTLLVLLREHLLGRAVSLVALHVDHGLRPESASDARLVQDLGRSLDLEVVLAELQLDGQPAGLEARAREARYRAFEGMVSARQITHLVLAHHQDDQVESVALRIIRRSGPRGLSGMAPERPLTPACLLLRPWLEVPRSAILREAERRGLVWCEDPSNQDARHLRNRLRHAVLPALQQRLPAARERLLCVARRARGLQRELESWAAPRRDQILRRRARGLLVLERAGLPLCPPVLLQILLAPLVRQAGLQGAASRRGIEILLDGLAQRERFLAATLPDDIQARQIGPLLFLLGSGGPQPGIVQETLELPFIGGRLRLGTCQGRPTLLAALDQVREQPWSALLDSSTVQGPLRLSAVEPGVRYRPLGAPGRRPVSRLLAEAGCPACLRARMPVVRDDDGPLWVPPGAPAERCRVTSGCSQALLVTWEDPPSALLG